MLLRLVRRNLAFRPWRSALLFGGFGLGVGVMVVLLSIGEAMLTQARDERLVGGGQVTVLPEGLDVEVMKTGGVGGLFFSINNARFVQLQLLQGPRLRSDIAAVAPQVDGKLVYVSTSNGRLENVAMRASGEIPSTMTAVGAAKSLQSGTWTDDAGDRRWVNPTPSELRHSIDHFHLPPDDKRPPREPESWAEWHYFNVLTPDRSRWYFISYIVAGDIARDRWGGQVLITAHEQGKRERRYAATFASSQVRFSTDSADLRIGESTVRIDTQGNYVVHARALAEGRGEPVTVDFVLAPSPGAYFPGATLSDGVLSGYAVPALRGDATGRVCESNRCVTLENVQGYHDHNWGYWQHVDWEWGAGRAGQFSVLYGRVQPGGGDAARAPLFVYLVDSLGFRALFRPRVIAYDDAREILIDGRRVRVPARATLADVRGADTLRIDVEVEDAVGTDTRTGLVQRGEDRLAADVARPYFIQMKGMMRLSGRIGGEVIRGEGAGFFETYR